jgi:hypothetical protein
LLKIKPKKENTDITKALMNPIATRAKKKIFKPFLSKKRNKAKYNTKGFFRKNIIIL